MARPTTEPIKRHYRIVRYCLLGQLQRGYVRISQCLSSSIAVLGRSSAGNITAQELPKKTRLHRLYCSVSSGALKLAILRGLETTDYI